ncbi:MAG: IPExxxVDY family protein [Flavobacteriales bacterium]
MAKTVLLTEFEYDFQLIGISSHAKDYRIAWGLNKAFDFELQKENDVLFATKKGGNAVFSMYFYKNKNEEQDVRLVSNKSNGRHLISEKKAADYFLILYDFNEFEVRDALVKIRKINVVLTAFEVDIFTLKSKENLLF